MSVKKLAPPYGIHLPCQPCPMKADSLPVVVIPHTDSRLIRFWRYCQAKWQAISDAIDRAAQRQHDDGCC